LNVGAYDCIPLLIKANHFQPSATVIVNIFFVFCGNFFILVYSLLRDLGELCGYLFKKQWLVAEHTADTEGKCPNRRYLCTDGKHKKNRLFGIFCIR